MKAGQSVVLFLTLANLEVLFFDNITCFLGLFFSFLFLVFFVYFFCSSHTLYVMLALFQQTRKTKPKKQATKKRKTGKQQGNQEKKEDKERNNAREQGRK